MASEQQRFKKSGTSPEIMELVFLDEIASRLADSQDSQLEMLKSQKILQTELSQVKTAINQLSVETNINIKQLEKIGTQSQYSLELEALKHAEEFAYPFAPEFQYQYKQVNAGEVDVTIWSMDLHNANVRMYPNYVAVITLVANSWYKDTELTWKIDVERSAEPTRTIERNIQEQLGSLENPLELKPRYIVVNECEWTATNNDSEPHVFWVYQRGFFVLKSLYYKLTNILLEEPDRPYIVPEKGK